jgi:ATP-dependent DNA ligase
VAHKLVDLSKLISKVGDYRTGTATALHDPKMLDIAKQQRRDISSRMIPLDADTARRKILPGHYLISRKIDGEFTCLFFQDGDVVSVNPYGTVRTGAPFHTEAAALLKKAGVKRAILGGELYVKRPDGKRARVHDVTSIARAPETADDVATLRYAAFAIYELDGANLTSHPVDMLAKLRALFDGGQSIHPVETVVGDESAVLARFKDWVETEGEEGVIALSEAVGWFKIKPRHSLDLAVIGYSHGVEDRANMLHSLLLAVVRDDGSYHVIGRTGGGFSDAQRISLIADLSTRAADSAYVEVNSDRVAYKMIEPGLVAEISCLDLIVQSSDGRPIEHTIIEWSADQKSWAGVYRLALASIISPQFVRLRDDKQASPEHTGLAQLTRIVDLPKADINADAVRLPPVTILRRVAATKVLKGQTMVRKLLMWQTNKAELSDDHPAFVLLLTDYSPNRKSPLDRDIRVSSSLEQIEQIWTQWHTENFVKGWVIVQTETTPHRK